MPDKPAPDVAEDKRSAPALDAALAVSAAKLEQLLQAAEKHAAKDAELAAAIAHFRPAE